MISHTHTSQRTTCNTSSKLFARSRPHLTRSSSGGAVRAMAAAAAAGKRKLLVSNDDGITAPGLRALVAELVKENNIFDVYVCAPSGERSAQSHAITLGRYLLASPCTDLPGTFMAFGVDGTPADSVMLALNSPLLSDSGLPQSTSANGNINGPAADPPDFDLVVSGINRGDNCGLHVIYSGTVGAAREAACKGVPALALSLDNHSARRVEDYALSACLSVSLIKAMLGLLPGQSAEQAPVRSFEQALLNVNFPTSQGLQCKGFHLTHMSQACVFPSFREVLEATGPHLPLIEEHTPNSRVFRNYAGAIREDEAEGGDAWAVRRGWVSVCPLSLRQDFLPAQQASAGYQKLTDQVLKATGAIIEHAATDAEMAVGGLGAKL